MKMNHFIETIERYFELEEKGELKYNYVGVRFENKERIVGDVLEASKYNEDREDERDFPNFEDEEYIDLPNAAGSSAWRLHVALMGARNFFDKTHFMYEDNGGADMMASTPYSTYHCYIIGGKNEGYDSNHALVHGEIVIEDAEVLEILF